MLQRPFFTQHDESNVKLSNDSRGSQSETQSAITTPEDSAILRNNLKKRENWLLALNTNKSPLLEEKTLATATMTMSPSSSDVCLPNETLPSWTACPPLSNVANPRPRKHQRTSPPAYTRNPRWINPNSILYRSSKRTRTSNSKHLAITRKIENYSRDINETVRLIRSQPHLPNLPSSKWKNVLLNSYVEFDTILSEEFNADGEEDTIDGKENIVPCNSSRSKTSRHVIQFDRAARRYIWKQRGVLFDETWKFENFVRAAVRGPGC